MDQPLRKEMRCFTFTLKNWMTGSVSCAAAPWTHHWEVRQSYRNSEATHQVSCLPDKHISEDFICCLSSELNEIWISKFTAGGVVVSTVFSQREGSRFNSQLVLSAWSLHVLPVYAWVLSGYSGFLPPSKNMHVRLTGDSKIVLRSECDLWRPVQVNPASRPMTAGIGSSSAATRPTD